jgi:prepilin-type processing-associated H-X9-DG protein
VDVYRCPSDDGFSGMHHAGWKNSGLSAYDYYGTSYAANCLLVGPPSEFQLRSISPYRRPVSDVPNPANTVAYMENAARYSVYANNPEEHVQQGPPASGCYWPYAIGDFTAQGWHGTPFRFNVSFVDGRVAQVNMKGHGVLELPYYPSPDCADGRCKCVVIRGQGYQLDTLPAPFRLTPKRRSSFGGMVAVEDGSGSVFDIVD